MPENADWIHRLALRNESHYVRPVCSCGWEGERRRKTNTSRAVLDGSHHVGRLHLGFSLADPTVFTWTRMQAGCQCGWEGTWYSREELRRDSHLIANESDEHRRLTLAAAWGTRNDPASLVEEGSQTGS